MGTRDWTLAKYHELLLAIKESGYHIKTIKSFLEQSESPALILRHDIDRFPKNALAMAEVEQNLGISATYYVRIVRGVFHPATVKRLANLGHEVGYHYEVLSKSNGDIPRAAELFKTELDMLRQICPIDTAAAHGRPLSKWNNHDIWHHFSPADFNLTAEAYESIDYGQVAYYTDTGRAWDAQRTNLRDKTNTSLSARRKVHTTDELIQLVRGRPYNNICIQTHPERWNVSLYGWSRSVTLDNITNLVKLCLQTIRQSSLA
jgi:hypothetical protein